MNQQLGNCKILDFHIWSKIIQKLNHLGVGNENVFYRIQGLHLSM